MVNANGLAGSMPSPLPPFRPKALCIDLETARDDALKLYQLAAWRADTGESVVSNKKVDFSLLRAPLDKLTEDAAFLLGHNVRRHDLPVLKTLCPELKLHDLRLVDTLELSPIAFPANPYHRLVKDYKLVRESRNDPLKDAQLALTLWSDQYQAMQELQAKQPELLAAYHFLLGEEGLDTFFAAIRGAFAPPPDWFIAHLPKLVMGKVCPQQLQTLLSLLLRDKEERRSFAYALAWLGVAGGNSVLPPWVRLTLPKVSVQLHRLRETSCSQPDCPYCSEYLDIRRELKRHFNFDGFRPLPAMLDGRSLQEAIVEAGYAGRPILAILPTGGGKSICYQLPALSHYWRNGGLTVVVSPLQSLMKDQVDNLVKAGVLCAATLNGMLSMPERREVLEKIRLGDVGILLVSPEQFRNRAFIEAIRHREVAGWVFDEAHCLSRWGHDFRPDYLYVTRFIRERYSDRIAPVYAFTATAKQDVIDDLCKHFHSRLGLEMPLMDGGVERSNLQYEVIEVDSANKRVEIQSLLRHGLADGGGAVVFVARRNSAEDIAEFLRNQGWACDAYHAGLDSSLKKDIQRDFIDGRLQVIVATNAFGMGVDKPDVRLVIHAEIPGSLENYLQEAGRAGRDQHEARCVLLFCKDDVDTQFNLALRSRLSRQDIAGILRVLKRHAGKSGSDIVLTSREILRLDPDDELEIDESAPDADTKVRTALHWLEQAQLLERNENQTQVFPGSLKVSSLEAAQAKLNSADLPPLSRDRYLRILEYLINSDEQEGISTDELTQHLGISLDDCVRDLRGLEKLDLLSNDLAIGCQLRKGVADSSTDRLERLGQLESALLDLMRTQAPDAKGEWLEMSLRAVCQSLRDQLGVELLPETVLQLLRSLGRPLPERAASGHRDYLQVRVLRREVLRIKLLKDWNVLERLAERRRLAAQLLLQDLLKRVPDGVRSASVPVTVRMGELADALLQDMTLAAEWQGNVERELAAVNAGLMFMHDNGVLILDKGKAIFRAAMTIRLNPDSKGRGFSGSDYSELRAHYEDRTLQIHVMHEYARLGLAKMADAIAFILAYFRLPKLEFIRRYFANRKEELERAATEESYQAIVGALNPRQAALVCAPEDRNQLILAGPGSGKTRVIVHRVAYLVRIKGEAPERILVLAYNRSAAEEIRRRLRDLLGAQGGGLTVLTYHALALRLTGRSLAVLVDGKSEEVFRAILEEAIALLNGRRQLPGVDEEDSLREQLLGSYRHILVDEYQDIDRLQYDLISALAGRTREADERLTLMAVGDDDQNIYAFRETSNEFIQRFSEDYQAGVAYLTQNYRSTRHIIDVANALIERNPERMKANHPISIDHARHNEPAGGRWQQLDPLLQGRVQLLQVGHDAVTQAQAVVAEIHRRRERKSSLDWGDIAILARTHSQLEPLIAWCESENIPYQKRGLASNGQPSLHQVREGRELLQRLRQATTSLVLGEVAKEYAAVSAAEPNNDWLALCSQFWQEQLQLWGSAEQLAAPVLIEAFYEFSQDARRDKSGALTLSTVHQAKGGQWSHVFVLDGGWGRATSDERRLYYVAATRAAEILTLCWGQTKQHPFTTPLRGLHSVLDCEARNQPEPPPAWHRKYCSVGLDGVFLSFAGRKPPTHPVHRALQQLRHGEHLQLKKVDDRWQLLDKAGTSLITLSRQQNLPTGDILEVRLESLVWREPAEDDETHYRQQLQCDGWWVPLPRVTVQPLTESPRSETGEG